LRIILFNCTNTYKLYLPPLSFYHQTNLITTYKHETWSTTNTNCRNCHNIWKRAKTVSSSDNRLERYNITNKHEIVLVWWENYLISRRQYWWRPPLPANRIWWLTCFLVGFGGFLTLLRMSQKTQYITCPWPQLRLHRPHLSATSTNPMKLHCDSVIVCN